MMLLLDLCLSRSSSCSMFTSFLIHISLVHISINNVRSGKRNHIDTMRWRVQIQYRLFGRLSILLVEYACDWLCLCRSIFVVYGNQVETRNKHRIAFEQTNPARHINPTAYTVYGNNIYRLRLKSELVAV